MKFAYEGRRLRIVIRSLRSGRALGRRSCIGSGRGIGPLLGFENCNSFPECGHLQNELLNYLSFRGGGVLRMAQACDEYQ